jgi:hypothetical protein
MQIQVAKYKEFIRHFIIFNSTGFIGFCTGTGMFSACLLMGINPFYDWLIGSVSGGLTHFAGNYLAEKYVRNDRK